MARGRAVSPLSAGILAAWRAAGVHTPILVPSSAAGNQLKAIDEVFAAFG